MVVVGADALTMTPINTTRVILGGLVAGLVANVLDVGAGLLMGDAQVANAQRLGLSQEDIAASLPVWIGVDFVYGLLLVFTYAAIRPRFGPGPKTAAIGGLVLYLAITVVLIGFMSMGMFMQDVFFKSAALSLVSTLGASLAGAAVYNE